MASPGGNVDPKTRQTRINRVSALLGEGLLKGHTMLNDYCAVCNTVIMQERGGKRYCVGCDIVDVQARNNAPAPVAPPTATPVLGSQTTPPPVPLADVSAIDQDMSMETDTQQRDTKKRRIDVMESAGSSAHLLDNSDPTVVQSNCVLLCACAHAQENLAKKLAALSGQLAATNDPTTLMALSTAIKGIVDIIAAIRELR